MSYNRIEEYENLKQFANSEKDIECLTELSKGKTQFEVSLDMGVSKRSIERRLKRIRDYAAARGWSPQNDMVKVTPEGYVVKGTSTLYDKQGNQKLQWVKTNRSQEEMLEAMRNIVEGMKEDVPNEKPVPLKTPISQTRSNLLNLHVLTDYHMGVLCWGEESGDDWDLSKAEDMLIEWFRYSIDRSPMAEVGVLANIGDLLHWDGALAPVTPHSGHILDADTRFPKLVRSVIKCMRKVISMMLEKYPKVHLVMCDANHDPTSEVWLREMFDSFYSDDYRITVDTNPDSYNVIEHGDTSLFFHHGHKKKIKDIEPVFVSKYRNIFGRTKFSYAHMGHLHHMDVKESCLMIVEQHRTMTPGDSYASSHGYCSGRSSSVITYHKDYGEVSRLTVTPEMLGY